MTELANVLPALVAAVVGLVSLISVYAAKRQVDAHRAELNAAAFNAMAGAAKARGRAMTGAAGIIGEVQAFGTGYGKNIAVHGIIEGEVPVEAVKRTTETTRSR